MQIITFVKHAELIVGAKLVYIVKVNVDALRYVIHVIALLVYVLRCVMTVRVTPASVFYHLV